ncbi:MAG: 23S rRNA (pseudouridine(1915)-N(3))-methyltransferase RlmH [Spirochaetes bacterium]|nr:23S rRNA (pseudouridine(1915)-N(3))-methyltransferase RlmH [Spirochaetota bacterium]
MKKIFVLTIGKTHFNEIDSICNIFKKRIESFYKINEIYIKESNEKNLEKDILEKLESINKTKIRIGDFNKLDNLLCFSEEGNSLTSQEFSNLIIDNMLCDFDHIIFMIGNRDGIPSNIKKISKYIISFSKLTFGHQIFKIMVYEQIYRSICLKKNIKYAY